MNLLHTKHNEQFPILSSIWHSWWIPFLRHLLYLSSGSLYPPGFSCTWVCPYSVSFAWFPFFLTSKEWTSSDLVFSLLLSINILLVVELINPSVLNIFYIQMTASFRFLVLTYPLPPPALHWFTDGLVYTSSWLCNKVLKISTSKIKLILLSISLSFLHRSSIHCLSHCGQCYNHSPSCSHPNWMSQSSPESRPNRNVYTYRKRYVFLILLMQL